MRHCESAAPLELAHALFLQLRHRDDVAIEMHFSAALRAVLNMFICAPSIWLRISLPSTVQYSLVFTQTAVTLSIEGRQFSKLNY